MCTHGTSGSVLDLGRLLQVGVHPAPYTLNPTPCTLHHKPYTLHPTPCTPNPKTPNTEPHTPNQVDPNTGDYDDRTALHLSASEGKADAVRFLLAKGADVNLLDRMGGTPLDDAIRHGHVPNPLNIYLHIFICVYIYIYIYI